MKFLSYKSISILTNKPQTTNENIPHYSPDPAKDLCT